MEYDLLTETGHELEDLGSTLSWDALGSFLSNTKMGSALSAELNPELARWASRLKTNEILADIYDQLSVVNMHLRVLISHKPAKRPEPYPRPGKDNKHDTKRIGNGALSSVADMREWIEKRRR